MRNCIKAEKISKYFDKKIVLKNIDMTINEGEIFGLLGPSGAGKTTLIKILTGQLKQSDGNAYLLGKNTNKLDQNTYSELGMVLDDAGLYERLTCQDNLKLYTRIFKISNNNIDKMLKTVGLIEAKKIPVMRLSKGMKQRLVIARALLNEPKILFLDEPTSGLDPMTAAAIHKIILEQKRKGTSIFLTTHNMDEAANLCDNIALLNEGNIIEYGNPEKICRKYNEQSKINIILKSGENLILDNISNSAELISKHLQENNIETIHSTEPDLKTIFVKLTGKEFN